MYFYITPFIVAGYFPTMPLSRSGDMWRLAKVKFPGIGRNLGCDVVPTRLVVRRGPAKVFTTLAWCDELVRCLVWSTKAWNAFAT